MDLKVPAVGGSQWTTADRQREEKSLCGNDLQTLLDFCGSPQIDTVERAMENKSVGAFGRSSRCASSEIAFATRYRSNSSGEHAPLRVEKMRQDPAYGAR